MKRPEMRPVAMWRYAASVRWIPSQFAYVDGFSQVVEPFPPHFTFGFALYLPSSPPQHAFRTLPVKPITQKKKKKISNAYQILFYQYLLFYYTQFN